MVDRLRAKPGGEGIEVTIGLAEWPRAQVFDLTYVVFHCLFAVDDQEAQLGLKGLARQSRCERRGAPRR